jgi:hypothetical protein
VNKGKTKGRGSLPQPGKQLTPGLLLFWNEPKLLHQAQSVEVGPVFGDLGAESFTGLGAVTKMIADMICGPWPSR